MLFGGVSPAEVMNAFRRDLTTAPRGSEPDLVPAVAAIEARLRSEQSIDKALAGYVPEVERVVIRAAVAGDESDPFLNADFLAEFGSKPSKYLEPGQRGRAVLIMFLAAMTQHGVQIPVSLQIAAELEDWSSLCSDGDYVRSLARGALPHVRDGRSLGVALRDAFPFREWLAFGPATSLDHMDQWLDKGARRLAEACLKN